MMEHLDPDITEEELELSTPEYTTRSATLLVEKETTLSTESSEIPENPSDDSSSHVKPGDLVESTVTCEEGEEFEPNLFYTTIPTSLPYIAKCPRLLFHPLHGNIG